VPELGEPGANYLTLAGGCAIETDAKRAGSNLSARSAEHVPDLRTPELLNFWFIFAREWRLLPRYSQ
jgi:hypothetical protein